MDSGSPETVIAQVYVYPYQRAEDGSRAFQKHHQGLSKLTLQKSTDMYQVEAYFLHAVRNDDKEEIVKFQLTPDFRARYSDQEHFLLFMERHSSLLFGFGTCKDDGSISKTRAFAQHANNAVKQLQNDKLQLQRQQSIAQSSLQATSSSETNKQNIDVITAFMPASILEAAGEAGEDAAESVGDASATGGGSSVPPHSTPHIRILAPTSHYSTNAELADRILTSNLRKHRDAIATDASAIPAELVFTDKPDPQVTGKDSDYDATVAKMGVLESFPTRKEVVENAEHDANPKVSKPFKVSHSTHISFDGKDGFKGVPPEWIAELQRQFGVPLDQLAGSEVSGYTAKIPFVLQVLRDLLIDKGGLETVGIFRLAPQAEHSDQAKADINKGLLLSKAAKRDATGKLEFDYEVHVISNLIKVWLRDLPSALVQNIRQDKVEGCKTSDDAWKIVLLLPDPYLSVCQYLIDFLSVVASHSDINKMPPTNVAICFCPNLFKAKDSDPMKSLVFTQQLSKWFALAIQYRIDNPRKDIEEQVDQLAMLYSTQSAEILPGMTVSTPKAHLNKEKGFKSEKQAKSPEQIQEEKLHELQSPTDQDFLTPQSPG